MMNDFVSWVLGFPFLFASPILWVIPVGVVLFVWNLLRAPK